MLLDKLWKEYFVSIAEYKQGDRNFTDKLKIRYINPAAVTVLLFPHISHIKKMSFHQSGQIKLIVNLYKFDTQITQFYYF